MMWNVEFCSVLLASLIVLPVQGKKQNLIKSATELLDNEDKRLKKENSQCPLKHLTQRAVDNHRLLQTSVKGHSIVIPCILWLLSSSRLDGWLWSLLGSQYQKVGRKSQANTCFKQATKLAGKLSSFVKEWHFIGPFVIGKTEIDGDPVDFYGGIRNISRSRLQYNAKYFSELVPGAEIQWKVFQSSSSENEASGVKISTPVNWNDLVSSLGSMGITEWQGWVVGEFTVNEKDLNVVVQCLGVHTVFIDDFVLTGDVYHRDRFWFSAPLERGLHTIYIHLRTKVQQNFKCLLKLAPSTFVVLAPSFLPDLIDGYMFSSYITFPVVNHHRSKWLKISKISVDSQSNAETDLFTANEIIGSEFSVAPGQTRPISFGLRASSPHVTEGCHDVDLVLKVMTSEGQQTLPITLRCRKSTESFLFTFLDHDGSVQHAAAIQPLGMCDRTDGQTGRVLCPVVLSLHGTTVPPQNQADSYKHMVDNKFVFGVDGAWLLAPTRHGAHNWEGPGALTAITALHRLSQLTNQHHWIEQTASANHVIFAGHSMGGHGAWHMATHFPDRALAVVPLAGWIKKEEYGDSNLFFRHDISSSHTDPAVKAVLEACIAENDADRHLSNLQGIPVLTRVGGSDRTVHPFFTRRMYRRLKEENVEASYTELEGKEHWWWDTWLTNDGGAVNDKQLRDFTEKYAHQSRGDNYGSCSADAEDCDPDRVGRYTSGSGDEQEYVYVTYNPAFGEGVRGVRVLQQVTPHRQTQIKITVNRGEVSLTTVNVARFRIVEPVNRPVHWKAKVIQIDGQLTLSGKELHDVLENPDGHLCKHKGKWDVCPGSLVSLKTRGPHNLGPVRQIAENKLVIVTGTQGPASQNLLLMNQAVYIANLFYLTSDTYVPILRDEDTDLNKLADVNVIVLGNPEENSLTSHFLKTVPVKVDSGKLYLEHCGFDNPRTGLMTLTPHGDLHLGLVIMGLGLPGMQDVVSLATPTIPPMTRSPFSNLLPDFVITGPEFGAKGPGGFECAGFWGNNWEYRADLSSCVCHSS